MKTMESWGRLSVHDHEVIRLDDPSSAHVHLRARQPGIAFGNGRSYGDICLNPQGVLWHTAGLDHFVDWDPKTGRLQCEAGVLLQDIQRLSVPQGWMLAVTPGTQLITVGGAIANDVHGKNHHALGTFGDHVIRLWLARTDGTLIECGPTLQPRWFAATVGGLGLTGLIVRAELQLRKVAGPWLETETLTFSGLEEFFQLADDSEASWQQTVSWIDCLAGEPVRGIFMRANPSLERHGPKPKDGGLRVPLTPPFSMVNQLTLRPFNTFYYHLKRLGKKVALAHYEPFNYPLDNVLNWNRMYGPKGFYQYQSVVPRAAGLEATRTMLNEIAKSGQGSFLAVLKTFGDRPSPGMLSFPRAGVTLAMDFPNRGPDTIRLFDRLDAVVGAAKGALYPAKDARMPREMFEQGFPGFSEFSPFRDPGISSSMSRRLMGN